MFQSVTTVAQLWEEYKVGLGGGPAIEALVEQHGNKWRNYKGGRQLWYWHKHIYDEIKLQIELGKSESEALQHVQTQSSGHT
jgi:hypothetical protein